MILKSNRITQKLILTVGIFVSIFTLCGASQAKNFESVKQLAEASAMKVAMKHAFDLERTNDDLLIKLTEVPAPPFGEAKRAKLFAQLLKAAGLFDVTIDKVGNVIGVRPGSKKNGRRIALSAHLDTVFPIETDVTVKKEGDKLIAPGIGDNTRGLVTLLSVLKSIQHANIQTEETLLFIGNVGEEGLGDLRGIRHLFNESDIVVDEIIVIDGGEQNRVITSGVGSHRYRVTFKGPGGHSWGAFGLSNPHHALGRTIAIFDEKATKLQNSTIQKVSHNIGRIGGGTSVNSIPFESWFEVDMRSASQELINDMDAILKDSVKRAVKQENDERLKGDKLTVELKSVGRRPAAKGNPDWALTKNTISALMYLGIKPSVRSSSTDASIPISLGIPALTISRGGKGSKAHSLDEYWINKDAHLATQTALLTLIMQAGMEER